MRTVDHQGETYVRLDDVKENLERIRAELQGSREMKRSYESEGMSGSYTHLCLGARIDVLKWVLDLDWGKE